MNTKPLNEFEVMEQEQKGRPEYRFIYKIVDDNNQELILKGSTYISDINHFGECESVDMEVASALRNFSKTLRPEHESTYYPSENE